jgi:TatD DNase family protein
VNPMTDAWQEKRPASSTPHALERDLLYRKRKKKGKFSVAVPPIPLPEAPLADTHAHLGALDAPLALARAAFWGFDFICCITEPDNDAPRVYRDLPKWREQAAELLPELITATDEVLAARSDPASQAMRELLEERRSQALGIPRVRLAIGCHPHTSRRWDERLEALERQALADPRTCAVGEIGLDYFYDMSPRETQERVFREQLRLANEAGVPVFLHIRDAHEDALAILQEEGFPEAGTILHCCSLPPKELEPWIDAGCFIAYGGIATFNSQDAAREGVRLVPHDRLLFETDSPYMAPNPLRGNQCYPDFSLWTALRLSEVRGQVPGAARRGFLEEVHANALGLQDRPATDWQQRYVSLVGPLEPLYSERSDGEGESDEEPQDGGRP